MENSTQNWNKFSECDPSTQVTTKAPDGEFAFAVKTRKYETAFEIQRREQKGNTVEVENYLMNDSTNSMKTFTVLMKKCVVYQCHLFTVH